MSEALDKSHWVQDSEATCCHLCSEAFSFTNRRSHCRECGRVFCRNCSVWKSRSGKSPQQAGRLCLRCLLAHAKVTTGVPGCDDLERISAIEVATNKEDTFEGVFVEKGDALASVRGSANAKVNLARCHVQGVEKASNGRVVMRHCVVSGDVALEIGGNNTVELRNCVVFGTRYACKFSGNAKLEAHDSFIIAADPEVGCAISLEANAKATLVNCVVTGADGILGKANAKVDIKGGSVSGQHAPLGGLLTSHVAIACKSIEKDDACEIVGAVSAKAPGAPNPIQKVFGGADKVASAKGKIKDVNVHEWIPAEEPVTKPEPKPDQEENAEEKSEPAKEDAEEKKAE